MALEFDVDEDGTVQSIVATDPTWQEEIVLAAAREKLLVADAGGTWSEDGREYHA